MEEEEADALEMAKKENKEEKEKEKGQISLEKLDKYLNLTREALVKAKISDVKRTVDFSLEAKDFLDMATRYFNDAQHFKAKGDFVTAFAALNYAHGWLDAGSRLGLFEVKDSRLFVLK